MPRHYYPYKILDPIHGFIRFDEHEKKIINSIPFQRLLHIHQLGAAFLVYPGARHSRFEHALGVMELASRIFEVAIAEYNTVMDHGLNEEELLYWKQIVRIGALCHDMGHLPFSHTAESSILGPSGHEKKTLEIIESDYLAPLFSEMGPGVKQDIIKVAIGAEKIESLNLNLQLSPLEQLFSKMITDDNFGADRIDYLIRDSAYTGVGLGHLDYPQLIDCLRILPAKETNGKNPVPTLGIEVNGLQSVESLWMARYLMYGRVYHHAKVCLYNAHLHRFLVQYYQNLFPANLDFYLTQTDPSILDAISKSSLDDAQVLMKRAEAFVHIGLTLEEEQAVIPLLKEIQSTFQNDIMVQYTPKQEILRDFPVMYEGKKVTCSSKLSQFLREIPVDLRSLRIYVHPARLQEFCLVFLPKHSEYSQSDGLHE